MALQVFLKNSQIVYVNYIIKNVGVHDYLKLSMHINVGQEAEALQFTITAHTTIVYSTFILLSKINICCFYHYTGLNLSV